MSVISKGAYAMSLGGFPCIRGYASIRDIARCSYPDPAYQRELTLEHVEEIKSFFEAGKYLFFPEIILSTTLEADYEKTGASQGDPLQTVMRGHAFISNVNGLRIKPRVSRYDEQSARPAHNRPSRPARPTRRQDREGVKSSLVRSNNQSQF